MTDVKRYTQSGGVSLLYFDDDYAAAEQVAQWHLESPDVAALTARARELAAAQHLVFPESDTLLERCVVALLGGHLIPKGAPVLAVMAAANRDPARFENPDEIDFDRADNRHLAFGWAAHFCFGAPLARIEGRIAFKALLERLPGLALATPDGTAGTLVWRENLGLRGLKSLPVRF